jgi:hypothetical protein
LKVLVTGDRNWADVNLVSEFLTGMYEEYSCGYLTIHMEPFILYEGGCTTKGSGFEYNGHYGADACAEWWALNCPLHGPLVTMEQFESLDWPLVGKAPDDCPVIHVQMEADWSRYGRGAGPIRNDGMLKLLDSPIDNRVLGFHNDIQNSKGTKHCLDGAKKLGLKTALISRY